MDNHKELRHSYLGGFSILTIEGFFWILSGLLWDVTSPKIGILLLMISGTFFYPIGQLVLLLLKRPKINKDKSLNTLFTQIGLIIPFSFPVIFIATKGSESLFFPALSIIVGAHFLPFVYAYKLKNILDFIRITGYWRNLFWVNKSNKQWLQCLFYRNYTSNIFTYK